MRRGTVVVLAGSLFCGLPAFLVNAEEPKVVQQLPYRPDLRRERPDKNTAVFRLLPTWQKSAGDPRQDTKALKSQPFRLLTLRDDPPAEIRLVGEFREAKEDRNDDETSRIYRQLNKRIS